MARIGNWVASHRISGDVFPRQVSVSADDESVSYVPLRDTAKRVRVHVDERRAIGHDECGRCGATVGAADRFCRMCGARLEGRR